MCGMLDHYLRAFAQLQMEEDRTAWIEATNHRPPCKPFLLMSVMDLIAHGALNRDFIEPSSDLSEMFQGYLALLPPLYRRSNMAHPFFNLQSDGFWELRPRADAEIPSGQAISSVKRLRQYYYGARVAGDLLPLMQMQTSRDKLRAVLIASYFSTGLQPRLWEQCVSGNRPAPQKRVQSD